MSDALSPEDQQLLSSVPLQYYMGPDPAGAAKPAIGGVSVYKASQLGLIICCCSWSHCKLTSEWRRHSCTLPEVQAGTASA